MSASAGPEKSRGARPYALLAVCLACPAGVTAAAASDTLPPVRLSPANQVPGCVTPERLTGFLRSRNPDLARRYHQLARNYERSGQRLGVRWDIAFLQMMIETANLTFRRPDGAAGDVQPGDNNFAGIGALGDGRPGEVFASASDGVRAHLEHVLHYAGAKIEDPVAHRTRKVQSWRVLADWHAGFDRPITYSELAARWAPHSSAYRRSIERLASSFQRLYCDGRPLLMVKAPTAVTASVGLVTRPVEVSAWHRAEPVSTPAGRFAKPPQALGAAAVALRPPPLPATAPDQIRASPETSQTASVPANRSPRAAQRQAKRPARISANDRVRQLISDRKVLLRTHVGTVIPIIYRRSGRMSGDAGTLGFFLGAARDSGKWWVAKGKLCQKWRVWLDRETHCMTLKERRGTVWWRADDGKSGTARIVRR